MAYTTSELRNPDHVALVRALEPYRDRWKRQPGLDRISSWSKERFRGARDALYEAGWIELGHGGAMRLAPDDMRLSLPDPGLDAITNEAGLEPAALATIELLASEVLGIDESARQVVVTARPGGVVRTDGGRWKHPDFAMVYVQRFRWLQPPVQIGLVTFELKLGTRLDVTAVHEALAHRAAATSAWVITDGRCLAQADFPRVCAEARHHGIGLIVMNADPAKVDGDENPYEIYVHAVDTMPRLATMDNFIQTRMQAAFPMLRSHIESVGL